MKKYKKFIVEGDLESAKNALMESYQASLVESDSDDKQTIRFSVDSEGGIYRVRYDVFGDFADKDEEQRIWYELGAEFDEEEFYSSSDVRDAVKSSAQAWENAGYDVEIV